MKLHGLAHGAHIFLLGDGRLIPIKLNRAECDTGALLVPVFLGQHALGLPISLCGVGASVFSGHARPTCTASFGISPAPLHLGVLLCTQLSSPARTPRCWNLWGGGGGGMQIGVYMDNRLVYALEGGAWKPIALDELVAKARRGV